MELEKIWNLGEARDQVVPLTVFIAVLCFCLIVGHLLEENRWVNESITALLIVYIRFSQFSINCSSTIFIHACLRVVVFMLWF